MFCTGSSYAIARIQLIFQNYFLILLRLRNSVDHLYGTINFRWTIHIEEIGIGKSREITKFLNSPNVSGHLQRFTFDELNESSTWRIFPVYIPNIYSSAIKNWISLSTILLYKVTQQINSIFLWQNCADS